MKEDVEIEFNPVLRITAGSVGPPGDRAFFIQASGIQASGIQATLSFGCEKAQLAALAVELDRLLGYVASEHGENQDAVHDLLSAGMDLEDGVLVWRIGAISVRYDAERDGMELQLRELLDESTTRGPSEARLWGTRAQMRALSVQAAHSVEGGRPICPYCTLPINPEGHDCPGRNGQKTHDGLT